MPLIQCHECSAQVSDHARTCPHCGAPVIATLKRRRKRELRWLLINLAFVSVMAVILWFTINHLFKKVLAPLKNPPPPQQQPAR